MKQSIPSICRLRVKSGKGLGTLAPFKQATPDVGLKRGRELHRGTSTFLHHHLVLRSNWRKPSLSLQVGYKAELGKGLGSSRRRCTTKGVCTGGEPLADR